MKKLTFLTSILTIALPALLSAQVRFEENLTWQQIKQKAKAEHKYIFVDCFATWCGPCKQMDQDVYPDAALGKFINERFISVKVQMDTSKSDSEQTKTWYSAAHDLMIGNNVTAYPSLLFMMPDGQLVHKAIGFTYSVDFLTEAFKAYDPAQQEYVQLATFRKGTLADANQPRLITALSRSGDPVAASEVAQSYISQYLLKLPDELLMKPDNLKLIGSYLKSSKDPAYKFFYAQSTKISQIAGKDYAENVIADIIRKEEILPLLWKNYKLKEPVTMSPDWAGLDKFINDKYKQKYADMIIPYMKIDFYRKTSQWSELANAYILVIEKDFIVDGKIIEQGKIPALNNVIYSVLFKYSTKTSDLDKILIWSKQIVDSDPSEPDYIDTYGNLLYKSGRKEEAISWETKAVALKAKEVTKLEQIHGEDKKWVEGINTKKNELKELEASLKKIRANQPTWLD